MLFNSYLFLAFLAATLLIACSTLRISRKTAIYALICLSLVFYARWNPVHLGLLLGSIIFNFYLGRLVFYSQSKAVLGSAISLNILVLAYFKYTNWITSNLYELNMWSFDPTNILLPLAISFFTFEQISYLVDCKNRVIEPANLRDYAFFVTFFPKLIAGPIVRFAEIRAQIPNLQVTASSLAVGTTLFILGLGKKVLLADYASTYVPSVFDAVREGHLPEVLHAWIGALAYTFQLYFDFSAYSDMAIGVALMFGINFPINFYSPYKATSIIDFWRRWHMTLSRFLRDYLYFPLGGSRSGRLRRYTNLILVMTIGGLWHGAGFTFLIWGLLHGLYLAGNHLFRTFSVGAPKPARGLQSVLNGISWLITFVLVVIGWVFFRAEGISAALLLLKAMFGMGAPTVSSLITNEIQALLSIFGLLGICLVLPNTNEIIGRKALDPGLTEASLFPDGASRVYLRWSPSIKWGVTIGAVALFSILGMSKPSPFLYFTF